MHIPDTMGAATMLSYGGYGGLGLAQNSRRHMMTKDPNMSNNLERNACTRQEDSSALYNGKGRHVRC